MPSQGNLLICISLNSTLRRGLARLHVSGTARYPIGGILSVIAMLHQLSEVQRGSRATDGLNCALFD